MTEPQARAFMAQVKQEFPEQIITRLARSQERQDERGYIVKLQYDGRIITAYKPDEWQEIKWCWGLENVPDERPIYHLVGVIPMILEKRKGYWYGRWQENGLTKKKYFGRSDPRPLYPIVKEKEKVNV